MLKKCFGAKCYNIWIKDESENAQLSLKRSEESHSEVFRKMSMLKKWFLKHKMHSEDENCSELEKGAYSSKMGLTGTNIFFYVKR